jgi:predicted nucleotidyltransferase component of viral defense system
MSLLEDWIAEFIPQTESEWYNAKREIMQEMVLAGLSRSDFFNNATFYGGTALRIFYKIERFSEDLHFSLNMPDKNFSLEPYFDNIKQEFKLLNIDVTIETKMKTISSNVESAFLKNDTVWNFLTIKEIQPKNKIAPTLKIKIEVDKNPSVFYDKEEKLLLRPYSFYVNVMTLPSLFAGKMHAFLFRQWKSRLKGRDWYDFEWFIKKGVELPIDQLESRAVNSGHLSPTEVFDRNVFYRLLNSRIEQVTIPQIKEDINRFLKNNKETDIWSKKYFSDLVDRLKIKDR